MWHVDFNDISCTALRLLPVERPEIPAPEYDIEEVTIAGRDGTLHIDNRRYKQIEIPIEFNYIGEERKWAQTWRAAKKWLSARDVPLTLQDDPDCYYHVYYVKLDANKRVTKRIGRFKAAFICAPYMFLKSGNLERKQEFEPVFLSTARGEPILDASGTRLFSTCMSKTLVNAMDTCHPLYRVVGNGICSFSINGNWMHADVKGELIIDTELQAAYRQDGVKMNQKVTGDYTKLYLLPGQNELMTGSEFDFYITPRWRAL